jgi:hypothetical protein
MNGSASTSTTDLVVGDQKRGCEVERWGQVGDFHTFCTLNTVPAL